MMTPATPFMPFPTALPAPVPVLRPALELARAAAAGNARATHALLTSLTPRIQRVVRAVLGGGHPDLEDVVQQSLLGFVQALPAFRGDCEPIHFASRIAARTAIATARRARAARDRRDSGVDVDHLLASSGQPHDAAVDQRLASTLRDLLARIPAEQAEATLLRIVLGWSLPEVAKATGAPVNTVRSRLRLAKNALRAAIEADPAMAEELGGRRPASSGDGDGVAEDA